MVQIVQKGNPVLRKRATEVPVKMIISPTIRDVISRMKEALDSQDDGVAIAAPQIGESLRIFLVSGRVIAKIEAKDDKAPAKPDTVYINPVLTKKSKKTADLEEGCLSVRYAYGKVARSTKATVVAYDESGKKVTRGGSGLMAQIFQHEIDHLDGVLFIDKAFDVKELPPEAK